MTQQAKPDIPVPPGENRPVELEGLPPGEVPSQSGGYLSLVSENRNFRRLWMGQIISLLGDWFNLIASASLIAALTNSGLAVGGLFVIRMLAQFLVSPIAGVAADRYNRKHILILTDIARGITVFGFLFVQEPNHVWLLYTLTAIQLAISGVFFPTRNAILPDIVSNAELGAANALTATTWSVMLAFGAALGGLVSGGWGIYPAFVIDALTFFISAVVLARIQYRPSNRIPSDDRTLAAALQQYTDGLWYLWRNRDILVLALHKAAMALTVFGAYQVIQVALAERVYIIGEGGGISLGLLYTVFGIGTGIGPILARRITGDRAHSLRWALVWSYGITILGLALIAPLWGFGAVLVGAFLRAIGSGTNWVFSTQLLLQVLPDRMRGRVFASEFAVFTLANATSSALGGWMLDSTSLGISGILWWMAALTAVPGFLWGMWLVRSRLAVPSSHEAHPPRSGGA